MKGKARSAWAWWTAGSGIHLHRWGRWWWRRAELSNAIRRHVGLKSAAAISPTVRDKRYLQSCFSAAAVWVPNEKWGVSEGGGATHSQISQSVSRWAGMQRSRKEPQTLISIHIRREFVLPGGESQSRFPKFAERLLFVFLFIILSRMRCQMEETGGADVAGFDVVNESAPASPPSFHQTPPFSRHPSPHYARRVNHSRRARLQIWMFSQRPTQSSQSETNPLFLRML